VDAVEAGPLPVELGVEGDDGRQVAGPLVVDVPEPHQVGAGHRGSLGDVEPGHGDRAVGTEDDVRGLGVVDDVGLGGRAGVAADECCTTHQDDLGHVTRERRLDEHGQSDVGERTDGHDRHLARVPHHGVDDEMRSIHRHRRTTWGREVGVALTVGAVDEVGRTPEVHRQWPRRAACDGNVGPIPDLEQTERVDGGDVDRRIAEHRGERDEIELGSGERVEDGHRVVDTGVGVDEDLAGSGDHEGSASDDLLQQVGADDRRHVLEPPALDHASTNAHRRRLVRLLSRPRSRRRR